MTLAIEIEFLTGVYRAASFSDRDACEWPPHPARFYSALVAAHHEAPASRDVEREGEREALRWLAKLSAPEIAASGSYDRIAASASYDRSILTDRSILIAYVPVNDHNKVRDAKALTGKLRNVREAMRQAWTPEDRKKLAKKLTAARQAIDDALPALFRSDGGRKPRTFPATIPHEPRITFLWPDAVPDDRHLEALDRLLTRTTRLGHSASLVRCARVTSPPRGNWVPCAASDGERVLRGTEPDQLDRLEAVHARREVRENRVLPYRPVWYRRLDAIVQERDSAPAPVFSSDWVIFQWESGPRFPLRRAVHVTEALRKAAVGYPDPSPLEILTGLDKRGRRSTRPHVAFVALPFVGHPHADGSILGAAAVLPAGLDGEERRHVLRALGRVSTIVLADGTECSLRRRTEVHRSPWNLLPNAWCQPATVWSTVTPILLDRFVNGLADRRRDRSERAAEATRATIASACERAGLPTPREIELVTLPPFAGVEVAHRFVRPTRRGDGDLRGRRLRVHAIIDFGGPVDGPVLLGAGRYLGLGLCRPVLE